MPPGALSGLGLLLSDINSLERGGLEQRGACEASELHANALAIAYYARYQPHKATIPRMLCQHATRQRLPRRHDT